MACLPGSLSRGIGREGAVAQLGERRFCKPEAVGSIPISSIQKVDARCRSASGTPSGIPLGFRDPIFDNLDG